MAILMVKQTCDDLLHAAVSALISAPSVKPAPSKGACAEIMAATLQLTNPRSRISQSVTRGRPFSALGELGWYLSGSGKTGQIVHYVRVYEQYDEDGEIYGAYGPRLRNFDGIDQLVEVIELLRQKPSSRRAVIQLYDHADLIGDHRDVPCTCTLQFLVRDNQLNLVAYMRSSDVYLGLPHDLFCFTMLQEIVARSLKIDLGSYFHIAGSLHLYDVDRSAVQVYLDEGMQSTIPAMPAMPENDPLGHLADLISVESRLREGEHWRSVKMSEDPYWGDLGRMYAAFQLRRGPSQDLEELRSEMSDGFYDQFIIQFSDRLPEV